MEDYVIGLQTFIIVATKKKETLPRVSPLGKCDMLANYLVCKNIRCTTSKVFPIDDPTKVILKIRAKLVEQEYNYMVKD